MLLVVELACFGGVFWIAQANQSQAFFGEALALLALGVCIVFSGFTPLAGLVSRRLATWLNELSLALFATHFAIALLAKKLLPTLSARRIAVYALVPVLALALVEMYAVRALRRWHSARRNPAGGNANVDL